MRHVTFVTERVEIAILQRINALERWPFELPARNHDDRLGPEAGELREDEVLCALSQRHHEDDGKDTDDDTEDRQDGARAIALESRY